ncbi:hypothetical protein DPMN_099713 [Dreissena polymorpha]|uniref:Uncharacterized protein n=1 Tax=Dreissena polymorpha TaxID=45954 RepID=A0A9D4R6T1_DREPO|nr:hypothetical protein DPMN_099713 [Dreissena polymorpha]
MDFSPRNEQSTSGSDMLAVSPEVVCISACKAGAWGKCSGKLGGHHVSRPGCSSISDTGSVPEIPIWTKTTSF